MSRNREVGKRLVAAVAVLLMIGGMATWLALGLQLIRVDGGSMEPTLPSGSIIIVKPTEHLEKRDIITFQEPGGSRLTTHTFIGYDQDGLLMTKGDANTTPDVYLEPLQHDDVRGKVVLMSPLLAASFWLSLRGLVAVVTFAVVGWAFFWPDKSAGSTGKVDTTNEVEKSTAPHPA